MKLGDVGDDDLELSNPPAVRRDPAVTAAG
jgi:hypothetical protein